MKRFIYKFSIVFLFVFAAEALFSPKIIMLVPIAFVTFFCIYLTGKLHLPFFGTIVLASGGAIFITVGLIAISWAITSHSEYYVGDARVLDDGAVTVAGIKYLIGIVAPSVIAGAVGYAFLRLAAKGTD